MREVTKLMINNYKLNELGYDFMGYRFDREKDLSFHHLIIPRRQCHRMHIPNEGYTTWNGAILTRDTAHDYLHVVEKIDRDMFYHITSEMVDENIKGRIDTYNLMRINDVLDQFERQYSGIGVIKEEYTKRIMKRR